MASRDSLSMLVTLELRERVNELSLASGQQNESEHKNQKCGSCLFTTVKGLQMIAFTKGMQRCYLHTIASFAIRLVPSRAKDSKKHF